MKGQDCRPAPQVEATLLYWSAKQAVVDAGIHAHAETRFDICAKIEAKGGNVRARANASVHIGRDIADVT